MTTAARFSVLLILFSYALAATVPIPAPPYTPTDSILLNCGAPKDDVDADGRQWPSDATSKFRLSTGQSTVSQASFQDPSLPSAVPYMTARIFSSETTYQFPISPKTRHWVRLHFYPAAYNSLNQDDALFSVTASNGFTLLRNFSASVTAQALTQAYIIKEFVIPPAADGTLVLTFTPSDKHNGSYAFVNGIEIISLPDLFADPAVMVGVSSSLTGPSGFGGFSAAQTMQVGSSALQTMFRLNVGGQYIPATNDTGMARTWYDDSPYLYGAAFGVTQSAGDKMKVDYTTDVPAYTAPDNVYLTARSMGGADPDVSKNYNLTWIFQVDANFTYVVRLHFCEFMLNKPNQRVFNVFVNNQTAQSNNDVILLAGAKARPVYKDYAIYVNEVPGSDQQLWLALHPSTGTKSEYFDAFVNGIEIFKLSDGSGNLAGPNPVPSPMLEQAEAVQATFQSGSTGHKQIIGGAAGGMAALGLVGAVFFVVRQRKKRLDGGDSISGWLPIYGNSHTSSSGGKSTISGRSTTSSHLSAMAAGLCRHFSIEEIKKGTKNFDESLVIGVGGFGKVYKGVVDGNMKVAIKRSNPQSEQGVHEFQTEIEMLSKLRHKHLVSLIGFCDQNDEMCLVYDYMAHGTLREHLYKCNKPPLSWKQRLEICIGSARGLHYLHTGAKYTIIHRDVKTTNILVDENWVAKVSDFGLSKTGPMLNQTHVSTVVKGSFGYLDPEYFRRQQLTDKSDVYSFGVVLFEVLCARPALNPSLPKEQVSLADWALHWQKKGVLEDIIDPLLKGKINPECLKKFAETAEKCLSDHGMDRPTMGDVLWNLEFALQLQESSDGGGEKPVSNCADDNSPAADLLSGGHTHQKSQGGEEGEVTGVSDGLNANEEFSQLIHPRGRTPRPTMRDVLWNLEFALQLQESSDGGGDKPVSNCSDDNSPAADLLSSGHTHQKSQGGKEGEVTRVSDGLNANEVFSQLIHPRGR